MATDEAELGPNKAWSLEPRVRFACSVPNTRLETDGPAARRSAAGPLEKEMEMGLRCILQYCLYVVVVCVLGVGCATWHTTRTSTTAEGDPRATLLGDVDAIAAYPEAGIVLIGCRMCQGREGIGLFEFSRRTQSWAGCSEGTNARHFIVKTDVPLFVCNQKLLDVGAISYRQFSVVDAVQKMKSGRVSEESYLDGTAVMVSLRWEQDARLHEVPFERCFLEKTITPNGEEIVKPFTPHFVYHGSGVLNRDKNYGCIVCQQGCSGGLICNNQGPCVTPVPMLKPNWEMLPPKGTPVTLVVYVMLER